MNLYLIIITVILIGGYFLNMVIDLVNIRSARTELPEEFHGYYDSDEYKRSQNYLKENIMFRLVRSGFLTAIFLVFIYGGFFNSLDMLVRTWSLALVPTGLLFAFFLLLIFEAVDLPFSVFNTFFLEQKYGFNKTTPGTFVADKIKSLMIAVIIGSVVLSCAIWFFDRFATWGWVLCWIGLTAFELFLSFIWPRFIMPLFNKFEPIEEGELKDGIENYAKGQSFKLEGIYKMDASRRSTKSNAFFAGLGKFKRIVLFDTLIENHTTDEIIAVLAHEIGHYKKKHLFKMILLSFLSNGIMFFILSIFITDPKLFNAFGMQYVSVYAGLFFFGFLYAPISAMLGVFVNWFSRKNEKEADLFVIATSDKAGALIEALKKLSVKNLSNLTPHPAKVIFSYSHPPVLERIKYIERELKRS